MVKYNLLKMDIQIIGTVFNGVDKYGDFHYMIESGDYNDSLFIYNDNEESYYNNSCKAGAGNALIRRYNQYNKKYLENPLSVGIPTGTLKDGGYECLNKENKEIINNCIENIKNIIEKYEKKRLFYSAKNSSGILGTGLFNVSDDVLEFITDKIYNLTNNEIYIISNVNKDKFSN